VQLRPFQIEALELLRTPIHLLCIAPTGSGKSLIYERVAAEQGRRTLLISPLVALARQQAQRLREAGISVTLHSGASPKPPPPTGSGVWIISPESLQSAQTFARIKIWQPDFLVVDECHCLYEWGDQFRRAFREIPELIQNLAIQRSLWLTATLPPKAKDELEKLIGNLLITVGKFSLPPNLKLSVLHIPWIHRAEYLLEKIFENPDAGIVFVTTRDATRRVQNLIIAAGRKALIYHAGLSFEERCEIEKRFRTSSDSILVATSAFGMGMDYPNLRWSILWQPPPSLLALAQALGRVGRRRELPASATVLWDEEDFRSLQWLAQSFLLYRQCHTQALDTYFNPIKTTPSLPRFCDNCEFCSPSKPKNLFSSIV
jgi:ATP-dependent DNA helicase RecQ